MLLILALYSTVKKLPLFFCTYVLPSSPPKDHRNAMQEFRSTGDNPGRGFEIKDVHFEKPNHRGFYYSISLFHISDVHVFAIHMTEHNCSEKRMSSEIEE